HAWDRFTHAKRARLATEREIAVLVSYLEASLLDEDVRGADDLRGAIRDHQAAARIRREDEARRVGLAWLGRDRDADAGLEQIEDVARAVDRELVCESAGPLVLQSSDRSERRV